MKQIRKLKLRSQTHYALFRADLPFKPKVEKDKTKFKGSQNIKLNLINYFFFLFFLVPHAAQQTILPSLKP